MDDVRDLVAQLKQNGIHLQITCDHVAWRVATTDGSELLRCSYSRELVMFLNGMMYASCPPV